MIAYLSGTVRECAERSIVIDVQGVGYRVGVPVVLAAKLQVGSAVTLHIHHHVSSETEALYGFLTKSDLNHFAMLLTVPSVGPRTALAILDIAPPKVLAQAVAAEDVTLLTKVSGVGRKTAERILVELKEKFKDVVVEGASGEVREEVLSALVNLGYTRSQARLVVQQLPTDVGSVEDAVKAALQMQG